MIKSPCVSEAYVLVDYVLVDGHQNKSPDVRKGDLVISLLSWAMVDSSGDTGLTLSQTTLLYRVARYFRQVHGTGEGAYPRADGA